ncbi:LPS export ABC transporter permease LptG [Lichenifustis flavocetrariae]|uniref:LPS export ABC transporter permease LptG n=1 Tax=Lichenifustis flavocetrariae TaxID=2949735 RepID=A0AA41YW48_9HYPH|nr:LPS export ABC transporter permease LptG [Lichenifustis flavocetrariae]MCW6508068.1 LPS export ABC transporter permease LptG [Lichenifustis flavocetrariae]
MSAIGFTLARYLSLKFLWTVLGVFGTMFALIYLIDFVELFRRSGDAKGATAQLVAFLSLLRVPAVAEQMLPFSVLFGAMFAFLNLTRKLELIVARAAGVSVWQFMAPPLVVALLLGLFAVMVYNPLSAIFKQRADRLETKLFGQMQDSNSEVDLWIRERGLDGQAILRAARASDGGVVLSGVTAFVYEPDGAFMERVESPRAELHPGYWAFENARVLAPDTAPVDDKTYLLATNLTPEQVTQSFVPPESVPFWTLPEVRDQTERAGLDATAYSLQYQKLLARPLLFVAMVLVAASFSLRFFRFGGVARMVSGGVASGFVLYVSTKLVGDLGGAGLISTTVAAWSPAIIGSMLGSLVLLYQEDG